MATTWNKSTIDTTDWDKTSGSTSIEYDDETATYDDLIETYDGALSTIWTKISIE